MKSPSESMRSEVIIEQYNNLLLTWQRYCKRDRQKQQISTAQKCIAKFESALYIVHILYKIKCMFDAMRITTKTNKNREKNAIFLSPISNFPNFLSTRGVPIQLLLLLSNKLSILTSSINWFFVFFSPPLPPLWPFVPFCIWYPILFGCKWINRVYSSFWACVWICVCALICLYVIFSSILFCTIWEWHNSIISVDCYNKFYHWNDIQLNR